MNIGSTIYAKDSKSWRSWLEKNHQSEEEIWLIFFKKAANKSNVTYNEAVEQALCFGWIDSIRKGRDEDSLAHRFTPRKPGSGYSQTNIERLRRMVSKGLVVPSVEREVAELLKVPFEFPDDILEALQADDEVWRNFRCLCSCLSAYPSCLYS